MKVKESWFQFRKEFIQRKESVKIIKIKFPKAVGQVFI
jgi:hypothetical protein